MNKELLMDHLCGKAAATADFYGLCSLHGQLVTKVCKQDDHANVIKQGHRDYYDNAK